MKQFKRGEITKLLLDFVQENQPCRYRDIHKFYQTQIHGIENFNPTKHRGGSYAHHHLALQTKSNRQCELYPTKQNLRWIQKNSEGKYTLKSA